MHARCATAGGRRPRPRRPPARRSRRSARRSRAAAGSRVHPGEAPCWHDHHRPHLVLVEPGREQAVGQERRGRPRPAGSPSARGRSRARECSAPVGADAVEDVLPGRLAGVRRREAALEQRSRARRAPRWSSIERLWHGNSGCVITISRTPSSSAASTTREDLVAGEVARREDQPVARDRAQHVAGLGQHRAVRASIDRHRLDARGRARAARAGAPSTAGTLSPPWRLASAAPSLAGESTVGIQTMRAPSRAAISTASGVHPADGAVERDRPEHLDARNAAATTTCARSAVDV